MPAGMLGKVQGGEGRPDKAVQMGYARPGSQLRLSRPQTEELTFSCANTEPHTHMDTLTTHTHTHTHTHSSDFECLCCALFHF